MTYFDTYPPRDKKRLGREDRTKDRQLSQAEVERRQRQKRLKKLRKRGGKS